MRVRLLEVEGATGGLYEQNRIKEASLQVIILIEQKGLNKENVSS